jgi:uncharacterized membrane protein
MTSLALAVLFLLATHFSSSTPMRAWFVARWGEGPWMGAYSLVSFVAFGWMVQAWRTAPVVWLWGPAPWAVHLASALVPLGFILVFGSVSAPNVMGMGGEEAGRNPDPARGVARITRHPMLVGTGLWAVAHLAANPDVASWWLFGGMAALSFGGAAAIDTKRRRRDPEGFAQFAAVTSVVPFAAILAGRQRWPVERLMAVQIAGGVALTALVGLAHPWLLGVPAFPS